MAGASPSRCEHHRLGKPFSRIQPVDSAPLKCLCLSKNQHHLFTLKPRTNQVLRYRIRSDDTIPGGQQTGRITHLPKRFVLYQPYPNPTKTNLQIRYGVPKPARVIIRIYDICGRCSRTLVDKEQKPGYYRLVWDKKDKNAKTVAAGIYFCEFKTPGFSASKKAVIVK